MEYSIKNIRSYKTEQTVSLNKMNVIVGENSAGKSTVTRILPLLAQSSKLQPASIEWFGEYVDFGLEENVKNKKSEDVEISFKITLEKYFNKRNRKFRVSDMIDDKLKSDLSTFDNYIRLNIADDRIKKITFLNSGHTIEFSPDGQIKKVNNEMFEERRETLMFGQALIPKIYTKRLFGSSDEEITLTEQEKVINNLNVIAECFDTIIDGLHYIGPYRSYGDRYYRLKRKVEFNLTSDGTNLISYLKHFGKVKLNKLNGFIKKNFDFEIDIEALEKKENIELRIIDNKKNSINIVDLGSGYSQILPVIISVFECANSSMRENHTVVIEQPELHLHPKLQKQLAYTLYDIVTESSNTKIIMETHSTDIVYALAECEGRQVHQNLNIFNCSKTKNGSIIEKYNVTDEGYINWPRNFLQ